VVKGAFIRSTGLAVTIAAFWATPTSSQQISRIDRGRAEDILHVIADEVRKHYYDPKFHGLDWDARVAEAKQKIDQAPSFNMAMSQIAAAMVDLNDSHTFLIPPEHVFHYDYGFQYQMIGGHCFITRVRPRSDAEIKGVAPGDELLSVNGFPVNRDTLWKLQYMFSVLRPQPGLHVELRGGTGPQRQLDVMAHVSSVGKKVKDLTNSLDVWELIRNEQRDEQLLRARYVDSGNQLLILKVPEFIFDESEVQNMINQARKHKSLIIDLRGNPGGSVETLKYFLGGVFDKEIKIADRVGRKEAKPEVAKPVHDPYRGNLMVLIDSKSASAAELFARVIQLEKRGTVVGDLSSGSVMEAKHYSETLGVEAITLYGASITEWDLIMADGHSLEHRGVTPDEVVVPTAADLASGRDPVLAHAADIAGVKIDPEAAGKAFPYEWPRQ
jgi:carboxyl-terminal processing protease